MILNGPHEPQAFLEVLRAGVGDRLLSLQPVDTEHGTAMGAARVLTLDKYNLRNSIQPAFATISLDRAGRVALEYHDRQSIFLRTGARVIGEDPDTRPDYNCLSLLIDDEEIVSRRGGVERFRVPYMSMFSLPWETGENEWLGRSYLERIKAVVRFLEQARHPDETWRIDDMFNPANTEARDVVLQLLGDTVHVDKLFRRGLLLDAEIEPGFSGHTLQRHRIVDRAAWLALEGLRP